MTSRLIWGWALFMKILAARKLFIGARNAPILDGRHLPEIKTKKDIKIMFLAFLCYLAEN